MPRLSLPRPLPVLVFLALLLLPLTTALSVNISRLTAHLTTLATHNDLSPPAVQRILYTPPDLSARSYLTSLFRRAGLSTREDALGNIFATWPAARPAVLTGSHFDAIPNSGMFDGTLGVLSALEAVTALREAGFRPRRSITIIAFTSEEPTRFGLSCIGSRVLSGALPPSNLTLLKDSAGIPFDVARTSAGYSGPLDAVPLAAGEYTAFVELHSEQGPLLESSGTDIGAVTAIAAPALLLVTFTGPGGHAGTTLMPARHDPSLAAAELSLAVEAAVARHGGGDTVATTGFLDITPNAVNSVPTAAKVGVDVRDILTSRRDTVLAVVESAARVIARKRGVGLEIVYNSRDPPATCHGRVVEAVVDAAKEQGFTFRKMVSRAYHDALFMAGLMPTGMIFVPCRGGISHRPDEFVAQKDMENGVRVLAGVLKRLAGDAEDGDARERRSAAVVEESGETVEEILATAEDATDLEVAGSEDDEEMLTESPGAGRVKRKKARDPESAESHDGEFAPTWPQIEESSESEGTTDSELTDKVSAENGFGDTRDREASDSTGPEVTGSRKPRGTGSKEPSGRRSREPGSRGTRKPVARDSRQPDASGSRKPTATGSRKPAATGSRKPTAAGSRKATTSPSRRLASRDSREPAPSGSRKRATRDLRAPEASGSRKPTTTGSRKPTATGSREPSVRRSRRPVSKGSRKPKVSGAEAEETEHFGTEDVKDFEEMTSETEADWDKESLETAEDNFGEEKDEL